MGDNTYDPYPAQYSPLQNGYTHNSNCSYRDPRFGQAESPNGLPMETVNNNGLGVNDNIPETNGAANQSPISNNIKAYNCGTNDLAAQQKSQLGDNWENVPGLASKGSTNDYGVTDGYQFRLSSADGTTVTDSINTMTDIPQGATAYFWDNNGGISFIGCQPSSLGIGNCSEKDLVLQYSDKDSGQWKGFVIDGYPAMVKSGSVLVTDIPGGIQLRLADLYSQIYTSSYVVPVDKRNYPSTVYFRTDGTPSTGGCNAGVNSVSIYSSYNVTMEIQVKVPGGMWQNMGMVGAQSTANIMINESSSIRLVNADTDQVSGIYNSQSEQKQVYFRTDGSIDNSSSTDNIHLSIINCQEIDLNVQSKSSASDDWNMGFHTKIVNGTVNNINIHGGSTIRFVNDDGEVASTEWTVPLKQSDVSMIYIAEDGQVSTRGCYNKAHEPYGKYGHRSRDYSKSNSNFSGGIIAIIIIIIIIIIIAVIAGRGYNAKSES